MKQAAYTAKDLLSMNLSCLPGSERGIQLRLKTDSCCLMITEKCRGGHAYRYIADTLPEAVKTAITMYELRRDGELTLTVNSQLPIKSASKAAAKANLNQSQIENALAKADLVKLYTQWMASAPWGGKDRARTDFMLAYTGNAWPKLKDLLGPEISWKTIERWKNEISANKGDCLAIADRRGYAKRGKSIITEAQAKIILACVLHPNRPRISESIRMAKAVMHARGLENGHSEATYRRWVDTWKSKNYHIYVFNREGAKAWNDKCAKDIMRDYSLINVGDIVVADGHTLNFETINPWTGKAKRMTLICWIDMKSAYPLGWEIMPTEDTAAISSALRRSSIRLGKYPKLGYLDNGRAFRARFFESCPSFEEAGLTGLYDRLGMKTIHAWPYHGQSKTVERFFGTLAELERWCPTYTGTSIEHKPPRMMRGEKLHRKVYEKAFGDSALTLEQTHVALAAWFDEYVTRPQRGHLNGATPQEVFEAGRGPGIDQAELDLLMMSVEIKHINKNGITFQGEKYYHPALYGRRHPVVVRYDLQDTSALHIFEKDGTFLCSATPPELVHPAATVLGSDEDRERLSNQIEFKRGQEKEASASARAFLEQEVMPAHQQRLAQIGILPQPQDSAGQSSKIKHLPKPIATLSIAEAEVAMAEGEQRIADQDDYDAAILRQRLGKMDEMDRYEALIEMQVRGVALCRDWQAFVDYFEATPYYAKYKEHYDEHRARVSIMYQMEASN